MTFCVSGGGGNRVIVSICLYRHKETLKATQETNKSGYLRWKMGKGAQQKLGYNWSLSGREILLSYTHTHMHTYTLKEPCDNIMCSQNQPTLGSKLMQLTKGYSSGCNLGTLHFRNLAIILKRERVCVCAHVCERDTVRCTLLVAFY